MNIDNVQSPDFFPKQSASFCCVYFLWHNEDLVYIGKSSNGLKRVWEHSNKEYTHYSYHQCKPELLDILEQTYIQIHKPPMNKQLYKQVDRNYTFGRGLRREEKSRIRAK